MRSRGIVVVLALILAVLATVGVFLYSRGVKNDALEGGSLVTVVVSRVDIPANTDLNALIRDDDFATLEVPEDAVVRDAITQVSQLQNRRNNAFILAGEQIPLSRVQGGQVQGGVIGIPEGHQAISVALGPAARGRGGGRRRRQRHHLRHVRGRRDPRPGPELPGPRAGPEPPDGRWPADRDAEVRHDRGPRARGRGPPGDPPAAGQRRSPGQSDLGRHPGGPCP